MRTVTCDDWTFTLYYSMRAFHPQIWIMYFFVIFICGFFLFNMAIVVLKTHYGLIKSNMYNDIETNNNINLN